MRNLYRHQDSGPWEVYCGSEVNNTIAEALALSAETHDSITFTFNEVVVTVNADSDPDLIRRDWHRALSGYIDGPVGPYPAATLTQDELANDAHIKAENEARREKERAQRKAKEESQTRLEGGPVMTPEDRVEVRDAADFNVHVWYKHIHIRVEAQGFWGKGDDPFTVPLQVRAWYDGGDINCFHWRKLEREHRTYADWYRTALAILEPLTKFRWKPPLDHDEWKQAVNAAVEGLNTAPPVEEKEP